MLVLATLAMLVMPAFGQDSKPPVDNNVVRKLKIRAADPALILLLLGGGTTFATPPEISTVMNAPGFGGGNGGFGGSGFGGGNFGGGGGRGR